MNRGYIEMEFDVLLPTVVFLLASMSVLMYRKLVPRITSLLEDRKFSTRDAVLIVVAMGLMVTLMALVPSRAIQIVFLIAYSYMMFSFTYIAVRKWYIAILPPIAFMLFYHFYWGLLILNLFVAAFAIMIPIYLGALFSWKTTWIFASLLTAMDVIQVFGTGFMGELAGKTIELGLPVLLMVPTYPAERLIALGLGDVFLAGLLAVQTALRDGQKAGILAAAIVGVAVFVFEVASFNTGFSRYFPATIVVIAGWIASLGIARLIRIVQPQPRQ